MSYFRDRVIVLKKEPFREHDRRYTMYGHEHGLLSAVARGSSLGASKQAGHLEPFSESEVMVAKGAAFDKLAVARMVSSPMGPSPKLGAFAVCGAFVDIVVRLTRPGISDSRLFDLLVEVLTASRHLPSETTADRGQLLLAAATLHLLDLTGFAPPIQPASPGTTPVPHLSLVSFIRRSALVDVLRVTAPVDVLRSTCGFVDEALKETPLEREPHGRRAVSSFLR